MHYTNNELNCFKTLLDNRIQVLSVNEEDNRDRIAFNRKLISKVSAHMEFSLGYKVDKEYKEYIERNIKWAEGIVERYTGMRDTSLFLEYDRIKKESIAALDILSDISAYLYPTAEFAEDAVNAIKESIIDESIESGCAKTRASSAVKKDERYIKARSELKDITMLSKRVFAKMSTLGYLQKAVVQSISSAKESAMRNIHNND